jgi:hypothetical protein
VAIFRQAMRHGPNAYYDPREVAQAARLDWRPGMLRVVAKDLHDSGYIDLSQTLGGGEDGGMDARILASGMEHAEELLNDHPEYDEGYFEARNYLTIIDSKKTELLAALTDLRAAVARSNQGGEADASIALSEIAVFEATIAQPRASSDLVQRFVDYVIKFILAVFGVALVGEIADRLLNALLPLLGAG